MIENQTANLTPGPSFNHNLCCRYSNGSCEAIWDIYTSRPFQRYKERPNARCFDPYNHALNFWESRRIPSPIFESVSGDLITPSKWGCDNLLYKPQTLKHKNIFYYKYYMHKSHHYTFRKFKNYKSFSLNH